MPKQENLPCANGGTLTGGKRSGQVESIPEESTTLTGLQMDRTLRLRWMAFLLEFSNDIRSHAEEFEQVLLLPPGHSIEAPDQK